MTILQCWENWKDPIGAWDLRSRENPSLSYDLRSVPEWLIPWYSFSVSYLHQWLFWAFMRWHHHPTRLRGRSILPLYLYSGAWTKCSPTLLYLVHFAFCILKRYRGGNMDILMYIHSSQTSTCHFRYRLFGHALQCKGKWDPFKISDYLLGL